MTATPPHSGSVASAAGGRRARWPLAVAVASVLIALLVCGVWFVVRAAREAGRRASCISQLKIIGLGLHNYHDRYGCFPPAYLTDDQGRPMHSWRVLVLPELGAQDVYDRYDFDQPWNSPHNLALADGSPSGMSLFCPLYHCPSDGDSDRLDTSYVMVVGRQAFSEGPTGRSLDDLADGSSHTIAIVEVSRSGIHWMEPRDLNFDEVSFKINDPNGKGVRSEHPGGINVGFADGSVDTIEKDIDPKVLKALMTVAGGEDLSEFWRHH